MTGELGTFCHIMSTQSGSLKSYLYPNVLLLLNCFLLFLEVFKALLCIVLEECRGTALGKKAARAGVFFDTDVTCRSRMQLSSVEHTRVRTVREIFASSGCKGAGALRFSGIKMYSGECRFKTYWTV